jgi:large subunit ribosomal protein L15
MVVRKKKHNRKYLGTRRWGVGNIKNARGKGSRGGVGMGGSRKHKFTFLTAKAPWLIKQHGFSNWRPKKPDEITLWEVDSMIRNSADPKPSIELKSYKVLSNGFISRPATIKAHAFSEKAIEKIKKAGGEAVVLQ